MIIEKTIQSHQRKHLAQPWIRGKIPRKSGIYTELGRMNGREPREEGWRKCIRSTLSQLTSKLTDTPKVGLTTGYTFSINSNKCYLF